MNVYYVYIVSNKYRTVLYTCVTNNLGRRIDEHISGTGSVFTKKYNCSVLLWYEEFRDVKQAIAREKQLKNWQRAWKMDLIRSVNPDLKNLVEEL